MDFNNYLKFQNALDNKWICLSYVEVEDSNRSWETNKTHIAEGIDMEEIRQWCIDHCKHDWVLAGGTVLLENDKDALVFRFRFDKWK